MNLTDGINNNSANIQHIGGNIEDIDLLLKKMEGMKSIILDQQKVIFQLKRQLDEKNKQE